MPGQKITITSISYLSVEVGVHTATFSIAENYPGAAWTVLGTNVPLLLFGMLQTPITTSELNDNTSYKIKCVLNCGTSFIKVINLGDGCPPPLNIEILPIVNEAGEYKIQILFDKVEGINNYNIEVYKVQPPGTVGSIFVNSYEVYTEDGNVVLDELELINSNVDYYFKIISECGEGLGGESDIQTYKIELVTATLTGINDPGGFQPGITITVTLSEVLTEDVIFLCTYKLLNGTVIGPEPVIINNGSLSGDYNHGGDFGNLDTNPASFKIISATPPSVNSKVIIY